MVPKPETSDQYVASLPDDRREAIQKIRKVLKDNLPEGYVEEISYGMIGYVIPFSIYPDGYAVKPKVPLPLINLGNTKGHIALHHMGVYSVPGIAEWFENEYPKHSKAKLDMGKGCIRFKNLDNIPYDLIGQLAQKIDVPTWIKTYETVVRRGKK
ncbi:MAG: DUF1801 domain-containing protein [Porphyromonadaceae bacterium]|jgi:uncharacterized protein YdhG (YjbR/CyaY superfamily)|nr:DUF1801 domain-containing protein [Porphyromonadaceae bacterium]